MARRGAILFFVLADMSGVSPMYQYALNAYLGIFSFSLRKALPDTVLARRLSNMIYTISKNVYEYGCTGIFERHKLLFSFQMVMRLKMDEEIITQQELDFFIKVLFYRY